MPWRCSHGRRLPRCTGVKFSMGAYLCARARAHARTRSAGGAQQQRRGGSGASDAPDDAPNLVDRHERARVRQALGVGDCHRHRGLVELGLLGVRGSARRRLLLQAAPHAALRPLVHAGVAGQLELGVRELEALGDVGPLADACGTAGRSGRRTGRLAASASRARRTPAPVRAPWTNTRAYGPLAWDWHGQAAARQASEAARRPARTSPSIKC
jgi:hypothetical protein